MSRAALVRRTTNRCFVQFVDQRRSPRETYGTVAARLILKLVKLTSEIHVSFSKRTCTVIVLPTIALIVAVACWLARPSLKTLTIDAKKAIVAGDSGRAVEKTQQLVLRAPKSIEGWILRAQAGALAEDRTIWEPAIEIVESANPKEALALWMTIGGREMRNLHAATAEHAFRRAIAISRDRPEPWRLLSQLLSVQGRPRETVECLLALIRLRDFTTGDLLTLAWQNSAINDPSRVGSLLQADPENLVPMLAYVGSALNENRAADAEQYLDRILARHPDSSRALALLGRLLADRDAPEFLLWQRDRSARAALEPEAWIAQGVWLRTHEQTSAATRCFHRAVELDPRHLSALSELGHALQMLGETSLGAAFLERAGVQQEISNLAKRIEEQGDTRSTRKLIELLEQTGRLWEAWAWCRLYQNTTPGDAFAANCLARLQNRLTPDLPRTVTETMPGRDFDWSRLAQPRWSPTEKNKTGVEPASAEVALTFEDEAQRLGIDFHFKNGPEKGGTIAQTSGGGVAAIDYDRDGWCDLYFTQGGGDLTAENQTELDLLSRNNSGEGFQNVTAQAGVREDAFSQGVAAGDFDNDGFPDLYVANLGRNRLLRNNGDGTFADVTSSSGLNSTGWTTSCAIADLNGDGHPELFSVRYAGGPEIATRICRDLTGRPGVCRPTLFPAEPDLVAINSGDGRYLELCAEAGLDLPEGRGFGLVIADFNGDRHLDVFVANDQTANYLLIRADQKHDQLRFSDEAVSSGVAYDQDGFPHASMGIASGDINNDGRIDLLVTGFADEPDAVYISQPMGTYLDMIRPAGLRDPSFRPLGFGAQFLDADLDGQLDLVVLNGHIHDTSDIGKSPAMLPQLYRGRADGRFAEVRDADKKNFFNMPRLGRGLCVLDWNRDGLPDFAGSFLDGNAVLATNRSTPAGHSLTMQFAGTQGSRDAVGTRVRLVFSDGTERHWEATAGDGFAASNEHRLHLGLGQHARVAQVEIDWPTGVLQRFSHVRADTQWIAVEGRAHLQELPNVARSARSVSLQ